MRAVMIKSVLGFATCAIVFALCFSAEADSQRKSRGLAISRGRANRHAMLPMQIVMRFDPRSMGFFVMIAQRTNTRVRARFSPRDNASVRLVSIVSSSWLILTSQVIAS